jgi:hypothetical protein
MGGDVELQRARRGFDDAVGRLAASYEDHEPADLDLAYIAAAEAVMWASAIDEHHYKHDQAAYVELRKAHVHGPCMHGLRLVRNGQLHEVAVPTSEYVGGVRLELQPLPLRLSGWVWQLREVLPTPERRQDPAAEAAYDRWLAGVQVEHTLACIASFRDAYDAQPPPDR